MVDRNRARSTHNCETGLGSTMFCVSLMAPTGSFLKLESKDMRRKIFLPKFSLNEEIKYSNMLHVIIECIEEDANV